MRYKLGNFVRPLLFVGVVSIRCVAAPVYTYKVIATYPHSTSSYTEGFFYLDGLFYESTGLQGHSKVMAIVPSTGKPVQTYTVPPNYFGEGIVDWGSNILGWTWQTHTGFVYDRFSFRVVGQFKYDGEGWGMTRTASEVITSDGTATLRFRDPRTFQETHHIVVKDGIRAVDQLNELEMVRGKIYANVWHTDRIAMISCRNGRVLGWIDMTGILADDQRVNSESVLNGIAYDSKGDRLFVTGKQWPTVFEIKIVPKSK